MLKKILGLVTILVFSAIGLAETDVSQIASDYPYKESAILATVLGTPAEQQYKFKNPKVQNYKDEIKKEILRSVIYV